MPLKYIVCKSGRMWEIMLGLKWSQHWDRTEEWASRGHFLPFLRELRSCTSSLAVFRGSLLHTSFLHSTQQWLYFCCTNVISSGCFWNAYLLPSFVRLVYSIIHWRSNGVDYMKGRVRSKAFIYNGTKYRPRRYNSCTLVRTISYSSFPLATLANSALNTWNMYTSLLFYGLPTCKHPPRPCKA